MFTKEINELFQSRFGQDSLLSLATCQEQMPYVRTVDAFYQDGAFYIITLATSAKMQQIEKNPQVALCGLTREGDWFTAHGVGENLGWFCKEENAQLAEKSRKVFASWIDNGHNDFADENTVLLQIRLTTGSLVVDENWYHF